MPQVFDLLHKADVERKALRQELIALREAVDAVPRQGAVSDDVQGCCMQTTAMQADLHCSNSCTQQVHALQQNMHQLQEYVQTERAAYSSAALFEAVRQCENQLQSIQLTQSTMQAAQQESLAALDSRITQVGETVGRADLKAPSVLQRLEQTDADLECVNATTQELHCSNAATIERLQTLSTMVQRCSGHEKVADQVVSLQQEMAILHDKLQQTTAAGQDQIHCVTAAVHSLQESIQVQKALVHEANINAKLARDAEECTDVEVRSRQAVCSLRPDVQSFPQVSVRSRGLDVKALQEQGRQASDVNQPVVGHQVTHTQGKGNWNQNVTNYSDGDHSVDCSHNAAATMQPTVGRSRACSQSAMVCSQIIICS